MRSLYKFIGNAGDVKFLLEGCLKFTPIPELNDPSELVPTIFAQEVRASLDRLRKDGYSDEDMVHLRCQEQLLQRLAPDFRAIRVPLTKEAATTIIQSASYDQIPLLERLLEMTAREMSSKVGLLCLTRRFDALPMWAHYAANASGLVVEFRDLHTAFPGDETGVLSRPIPVRYERERLGVTFDPRSHYALFFAKFLDWRYEREVRVVLPLADCRSATNGDRRLFLYDVPRSHIVRLIVGWRMPSLQVDEVLSHVRLINPTLEVRRADIHKGRVHLADGIHP